ncbi:hypothetical protein [Catenulispora rubra]|uniref:hypothetical protein n=1 Tax=Catenulispora rubra TaxID=280293 RepID=UPI001891F926|nr:hypothetical protein [Catenulispora rubra]
MRLGRKEAERRGGYTEWAEYLTAWGDGGEPDGSDGSALGPLDPKDFASDTWRRITDRFTDALARRLEGWHKAFAKAAAHAVGDEFEYGRALQQGRDGLIPVLALAGDPRLPEELRTGLTTMVESKISDMQRQLERDIERQRDRGDSARMVETRLRTLRENPLTAVVTGVRAGVVDPRAIPAAGLPTKRVIGR